MPRKLQVFVSSTYTDLIKERQAAVGEILHARHIPAGMELFSAGDQSQLNVIKRWINDSDLFMLILGGRYGSIEPQTGNSYIQVEYEYAVDNSVPVFTLVLTDNFLKAKCNIVLAKGGNVGDIYELNNPQKYTDFKNKVHQRMCKYCDNISDIKLGILESLIEFTHDSYYEFQGWVRGSELKQVKAQILTFTDENQKLKVEIENLKKDFPRTTERFESKR